MQTMLKSYASTKSLHHSAPMLCCKEESSEGEDPKQMLQVKLGQS